MILGFANQVYTAIVTFFSASGVWLALQGNIEQIPQIPAGLNTPESMMTALGAFMIALLAAFNKQSNSIKNIDENIAKLSTNISTQLEVLNKMCQIESTNTDTLKEMVKRDEEKFEKFMGVLNRIDSNEKAQLNELSSLRKVGESQCGLKIISQHKDLD